MEFRIIITKINQISNIHLRETRTIVINDLSCVPVVTLQGMENIARGEPSHLHEYRARLGDDIALSIYSLVPDRRQTVASPLGPIPHAPRIPFHRDRGICYQV